MLTTCEECRRISVKESGDQTVKIGACCGHDDVLESGYGIAAVSTVETMPVDVQISYDAGENF